MHRINLVRRRSPRHRLSAPRHDNYGPPAQNRTSPFLQARSFRHQASASVKCLEKARAVERRRSCSALHEPCSGGGLPALATTMAVNSGMAGGVLSESLGKQVNAWLGMGTQTLRGGVIVRVYREPWSHLTALSNIPRDACPVLKDTRRLKAKPPSKRGNHKEIDPRQETKADDPRFK